MVKQKLDPEVRKNILKARKWIEALAQKDANEAETRTRIHDICGLIMGYDRFEHISFEYEIPGVGETIHCDLAIKTNQGESSKPDFLVEIKRVSLDLLPKHVGQAARYAIDIGCEWVLLTNSRDWRLYHISFVKPPQTTLVESWDILNDTPATLSDKFSLICYKNIKRSGLARLWEKRNVLSSFNLLKIILSEQSLTLIRREIRKATEVTVSPEDIVGAIRKMLNQEAIGEMEKIRISLPVKKQKKPVTVKENVTPAENSQVGQNGQ
jgi:hypothetical protein